MKISRVKTEAWHKWDEGDTSAPINNFFKKKFWKRYDKKKFLRKIKNIHYGINRNQ